MSDARRPDAAGRDALPATKSDAATPTTSRADTTSNVGAGSRVGTGSRIGTTSHVGTGAWAPGPVEPAAPTRSPRPLPLRVELARQLTRWRTRGVLLILAVLPVIIWLAFLIGRDDDGEPPDSPGADLAAQAQASGANFTAFTLAMAAGFLLTMVVALFFGDMVAGEASWSTLKYLLTIPVSRGRLLGQKVAVSLLLAAAGLALLAGIAFAVGVLAYGTGGLQTPLGEQLGLGESVARLAAASALVGIHLLWAAGLGTLLTVLTDAPLGAAGGVVLASILSAILDAITALGDLRVLLPTHYSNAFQEVLLSPVDAGEITASVLSALAYALVFGTLAAWHFHRKDITS